MLKEWQQIYSQLSGYIEEHPEIEISAGVVSIPENVRSEFWHLCDLLRRAYLEEEFSDLLHEATMLEQHYVKSEQEVTRLLKLKEVSMEASLGRFLHDPIDQLVRVLSDSLFNLLKAKVDVKGFKEEAIKTVKNSFRRFYSLGYEKWVVLSLVILCRADEILRTEHPRSVHAAGLAKLEMFPESENVRIPEKSNSIFFHHSSFALFTVPDFIIHSATTHKKIAFRSYIVKPLLLAGNASDNREWIPIRPMAEILSDFVAVYSSTNINDIFITADAARICRPDLIVEYKTQANWYEEEMRMVKLHHEMLKPILGTFVVSMVDVPEKYSGLQDSGINVLEAGFDQSRLEPIVSALMTDVIVANKQKNP